MTTGLMRLGRRLLRLHEQCGMAVGTSAEGVTLILYEGWHDRRGRLRILKVISGRWVMSRWQVNLDVTRRMAAAVLGKNWSLEGREWLPEFEPQAVCYAVPLDRGYADAGGWRVPDFHPSRIRWFNARGLAQGLGEQDNGVCTWKGWRLLPAE